ncbi:hypothetical protein SteCoe_11027 [Stentor coeruleus]|uniref:Enoyl-CoA hydratase/isomerase domain-containing protein n=1 Tax=Stentor coeruleus TaxID=5963 RepID=A0A1R2CE61_9CILI|nr:hypothetical protein SteCoe_11027 [Stentor coeruleus]
MNKDIVLNETERYLNIHYNRPKALNALSDYLIFATQSSISRTSKGIILTGEGRSFCSGGDILEIVRRGHSPRFVFTFPASLFYYIHTRQQETISLIDGLAIGGGAGYALSCSSKILTEKTSFSIPETHVGHTPDVGACYHLNKLCSEQLGIYMIVTGNSITGADTYFAGFSDIFIPKITREIKDHIMNNGVHGLEKFQVIPDSEKSSLLRKLPIINECFDRNYDVETMCRKLSSINNEWSRATLKTMLDSCPLSIKAGFECFKKSQNLNYLQSMELEYNLSINLIENTKNFANGVRTKMIEKKNCRPQWEPLHLWECSESYVESFFYNQDSKLVHYKL